MRYTVGSSLMSLITSHIVLISAACNAAILDETQKCIKMGITIFKNFIWRGISSDIRSEIMFYGSASASP